MKLFPVAMSDVWRKQLEQLERIRHQKDSEIVRNDERIQANNEEKSIQMEQKVEPVQMEDQIYRRRQSEKHQESTEVLRNEEKVQSISGDKSTQTEQIIEPVQIEDKIYSLSQSENQISGDKSKVLEVIRDDNFRGIGDIIRNRKFPAPKLMATVIKEFGYSKGVQCLLRGMSNLLKKTVHCSTGAWCGYRPREPYTPVFVVNLSYQMCMLEQTVLTKPFDDYEIVFRYDQEPNDEETIVSERSASMTMIKADDMLQVHNCIVANAKRLMQEHRNLSIIRASPIKTSGYKYHCRNLTFKEETCVVFYVPVKGIVPMGEEQFPVHIEGIVTDVREGEFVYYGSHKAHKYQRNLRMGCRISTTHRQEGTLGGFLDLPDNKIGFITAAHVVLTPKEIKTARRLKIVERHEYNRRISDGSKQLYVYQYDSKKPIGRVCQISLEPGSEGSISSVDAAVIEITDTDRKPDTGEFPIGDFENIGFTRNEPMQYYSGKTIENISTSQKGSLVIKYGSVTGITRGCLDWDRVYVRRVDMEYKTSFPVLFNQLVIKSSDDGIDFSCAGDSGALVFLCVGGNIHDLHAVGMVIGGTTNRKSARMCIVTPISAIKRQLGFSKFKYFAGSEYAEQSSSVVQDTEYERAREKYSIKAADNQLKERLNQQENTVLELRTYIKKTDAKADKINDSIRSAHDLLNERLNKQENTISELANDMKQLHVKTDQTNDSINALIGLFQKKFQNQ